MRKEREYYRIHYPVDERPRLVVGDAIAEVVEIAEYGVCFLVRPLGHVQPKQEIAGELRLGGRWKGHVEGAVVWVTEGKAAIRLSDPIPFKVILDEQLRLRARYLP